MARFILFVFCFLDRYDGIYAEAQSVMSGYFSAWIRHCERLVLEQGSEAGFDALEKLFHFQSKRLLLLSYDVKEEIEKFFKKDGRYVCSVERVREE